MGVVAGALSLGIVGGGAATSFAGVAITVIGGASGLPRPNT